MRKHFLFHLLTVVVTLLLAGCSEKEKEILVESIALSQPSAEMELGETLTLKATVSPSNASYDGITWTSTNPKVASVTTSGLVTALSEGNTTITVMAGGRTASCAITVVKGFVAVTSISLNKTSLEIIEGESETLVATVFPDDATDKTIIWTSSNEAVITVKDGTVTAIKEGESTVSAKAGDKTASCTVIVKKKVIAIDSIELNKTELILVEGESETLTATVKPDDATDKSVSWISTNESIATVDNSGKVTAVKDGETTITATAGEKSATCKVVVQKKVIAVESVELSYELLELVEGDSKTLSAIVKPDDATDKSVTWTSSNSGVATVKDGVVTAIREGEATITAKAGDKSATCKVVVSKKIIAVESITLNKTELSLVEGNTETLIATVTPDDATDKTVTWTSSNTSVALVKDGVVTAVKEGEATITAKAGDKSATCKVVVSKKIIAVESVVLNKTELTLSESESEILSATILPEDATDKSVSWESSDKTVATVDGDGRVTAIKKGEALITAKVGEKSASCKVTVQSKVIAVESIELNQSELSLYEGDTATLTATVKPDNATDKTVTWTSSNSSIVMVDSDGLVKAISKGSATITASAGGVSAMCSVTVRDVTVAVTGVSLDVTMFNLEIGKTATLIATVRPSNATNKDVTWSSSDTSIASVSSSGVVTGKAEGTATITVKTKDGAKTATCWVTVVSPRNTETIDDGNEYTWD